MIFHEVLPVFLNHRDVIGTLDLYCHRIGRGRKVEARASKFTPRLVVAEHSHLLLRKEKPVGTELAWASRNIGAVEK